MSVPHATPRAPPAAVSEPVGTAAGKPHAAPAVRRFARELGVDLTRVQGSGREGRILESDVKAHVKQVMTGALAVTSQRAPGEASPPKLPEADFERFGPVEVRPLERIRMISGARLRRAWLNVPRVSHHDEADVTELETLRQGLREDRDSRAQRLSLLTFLMKALASTLLEFPVFSSSLGADGESLVYKKYVHIGIAVDTAGGLVVPVIRDADRKGVLALAEELAAVGERARAGKLGPSEMEGGCMTMSSLGGIGSSAFSPIVNAPEVAILGVSRAQMKPVWNGAGFVPRLLLPLDLSYDHRVIDGAEAARFLRHYCALLADLRRLAL